MRRIMVVAALGLLTSLSTTAQTYELPRAAKNHLRANYPGWTVGESWRGDEPRRPAVGKGDFNDDGRPDVAVVINKDERTYAIALVATKNGYKAYNLLAQAGDYRWIAGIDVKTKGQVMTGTKDINKKLRLKCDTVFLYDGEGMGRNYLWENGGFKELEGFE